MGLTEKQVAGRCLQMVALTTTVTLIWFQPRGAVLLLVCHDPKCCHWIRHARALLSAWARGNFAPSALVLCSRQPGQNLLQKGNSVCCGQHTSPWQSPGTAQEPLHQGPHLWPGDLQGVLGPQGSLWWGWGNMTVSSSAAVLKLAPLLDSVWTHCLVKNSWLVHAGVWFRNYATAFH